MKLSACPSAGKPLPRRVPPHDRKPSPAHFAAATPLCTLVGPILRFRPAGLCPESPADNSFSHDRPSRLENSWLLANQVEQAQGGACRPPAAFFPTDGRHLGHVETTCEHGMDLQDHRPLRGPATRSAPTGSPRWLRCFKNAASNSLSCPPAISNWPPIPGCWSKTATGVGPGATWLAMPSTFSSRLSACRSTTPCAKSPLTTY